MTDEYETPTLDELADAAKRSYQTVEEMAYQVIRQGIVSGVYRPGERLPQDTIAKALGVSRIPVRAGLRQLEAEGFVTLKPHRGGTVRELSVAELEEVYELRCLLEAHAVRAACGRVTDEQIDELAALEDDAEAAVDPIEWVDLRERFYSRLYEIADLPLTAKLIARLRADVGRYWLMQRVAEDHDHSLRAILDALRRRDADAAGSLLQGHLEDVSAQLVERVKATSDGAAD